MGTSDIPGWPGIQGGPPSTRVWIHPQALGVGHFSRTARRYTQPVRVASVGPQDIRERQAEAAMPTRQALQTTSGWERPGRPLLPPGGVRSKKMGSSLKAIPRI